MNGRALMDQAVHHQVQIPVGVAALPRSPPSSPAEQLTPARPRPRPENPLPDRAVFTTGALIMWSRQRAEDRAAREFVDRLVNPWRRVCERVPGLSHTVQSPPHHDRHPDPGPADLSGPPGAGGAQDPRPAHRDFRADEASRRIARRWAMTGSGSTRGSEWVRIELLIGDPSTARSGSVGRPRGCRSPTWRSPSPETSSATLCASPGWRAARLHSGATRSGKSVWCYSALAQLARLDDVLIAGLTCRLLLGRPYVVPGTTSGRPPVGRR
ncbi:hypothetical protein Ae717Ps2_7214 [Pseudonocardia sp. Ae717_Ps2]|nr:hypothetical protein Ae717Ps2_7214 [Pseudonocardia sp. Ae717_Ps2]